MIPTKWRSWVWAGFEGAYFLAAGVYSEESARARVTGESAHLAPAHLRHPPTPCTSQLVEFLTTHPHRYIYIYIFIYICVCGWVW